jgi:hypothetical protein
VHDVQPASGLGRELDRPEDGVNLGLGRAGFGEVERTCAAGFLKVALDDLLCSLFRVPENGKFAFKSFVGEPDRELKDRSREMQRWTVEAIVPPAKRG